MATSTLVTAGQPALALDGAAPAPLRSALPPSYRIDRMVAPGAGAGVRSGATVALGEMAAEFDLTGPGPLVDWVQSLADGNLRPAQVGLLVLDVNGKLQRRVEASDSLLTAVRWPLLSATAARQAVTVGLRWQPARVDEQAGGGSAVQPARPRKQLLASNFRVQGLPFDASGVREVALPGLQARLAAPTARRPAARLAGVALDPLVLTLGGRSLVPARDWVRKLLAGQPADAGQALVLVVELLDAALRQVRASVSLDGCALLACEESALGGAAEAPPSLTLRFAVARLGLKVPAA